MKRTITQSCPVFKGIPLPLKGHRVLMKPRVWLEFRLPSNYLASLKGLVEIADGGDPHKLAGSTVAIRSPGLEIDASFMDSVGAQLQLLTMPGAGLDHIDIPAASERGILVCNNPDAPTESTAEHTVGLLLASAKNIVAGDRQLRGRNIVPHQPHWHRTAGPNPGDARLRQDWQSRGRNLFPGSEDARSGLCSRYWYKASSGGWRDLHGRSGCRVCPG